MHAVECCRPRRRQRRGGCAASPTGVLLDTIRASRKALVAVNLGLSPAEADKFWPLYDRYQKEISTIGDRVVAIVDDYTASFRDLSNDKAMQLMESYLAAEAERLQVHRSYLGEFTKIRPGRTVARFYQIENKMDAVLRYDLAATIPIVDEKRGAPAGEVRGSLPSFRAIVGASERSRIGLDV
jgi:hypothetical protein